MFCNCLIQDGECRCACHRDHTVKHIMPCCDKPPAPEPGKAENLCPDHCGMHCPENLRDS